MSELSPPSKKAKLHEAAADWIENDTEVEAAHLDPDFVPHFTDDERSSSCKSDVAEFGDDNSRSDPSENEGGYAASDESSDALVPDTDSDNKSVEGGSKEDVEVSSGNEKEDGEVSSNEDEVELELDLSGSEQGEGTASEKESTYDENSDDSGETCESESILDEQEGSASESYHPSTHGSESSSSSSSSEQSTSDSDDDLRDYHLDANKKYYRRGACNMPGRR